MESNRGEPTSFNPYAGIPMALKCPTHEPEANNAHLVLGDFAAHQADIKRAYKINLLRWLHGFESSISPLCRFAEFQTSDVGSSAIEISPNN